RFSESSDLFDSMRAIPAAFQYSAVASSATATNAPPMPEARAPTSIFRNWPSNVPTFSKILAAPAIAGISIPIRPQAARTRFTSSPPSFTATLADDDKVPALRALTRIHREEVDAA